MLLAKCRCQWAFLWQIITNVQGEHIFYCLDGTTPSWAHDLDEDCEKGYWYDFETGVNGTNVLIRTDDMIQSAATDFLGHRFVLLLPVYFVVMIVACCYCCCGCSEWLQRRSRTATMDTSRLESAPRISELPPALISSFEAHYDLFKQRDHRVE